MRSIDIQSVRDGLTAAVLATAGPTIRQSAHGFLASTCARAGSRPTTTAGATPLNVPPHRDADGSSPPVGVPPCGWPNCENPAGITGYCVPHDVKRETLAYEASWEENHPCC